MMFPEFVMRASSHAVEILQIGPYPDWDQVPLDAALQGAAISRPKTRPIS